MGSGADRTGSSRGRSGVGPSGLLIQTGQGVEDRGAEVKDCI